MLLIYLLRLQKEQKKANYDGVQIHAAHFFFLSRFISPIVNHRKDKYGGSTQNRIRILIEILKGIKDKNLGLHISLKINSNDFYEGGIEEEGCLEICKMMANEGIDSIEISGNGTSRSRIKAHVNEAYFKKCAEKVAESVNVPIALVGGIRSKKTIEDILEKTKIEIISLSRPLVNDPDFPKKWNVVILKTQNVSLVMDAIVLNVIDAFLIKKRLKNEYIKFFNYNKF